MGKMRRAQLDALVEEATVDCCNEDEQVTGLYAMIEDNLAMPFQTTVLGVEATVEGVDLTEDGHIVANCRRGSLRQTIPVLDLPLPTPAHDGAQWIGAYRYWVR